MLLKDVNAVFVSQSRSVGQGGQGGGQGGQGGGPSSGGSGQITNTAFTYS